jgi:ribonuclease BN (tRNA processing enzyme)
MRIRVLGCSGGSAPGCYPSCYLLDGGVAVDAGALAARLTLEEQREVEHVFLTHSHWDHVRDLPLTVINRTADDPTQQDYSLPETEEAIRKHLMNDTVWFSAFDLPSLSSPFIAATEVGPGAVHERNGYRISCFPVPHTVPAISYLVDDGTTAVVLSADTGGGGVLERIPAGHSPLAAVFLEASFPNDMHEFAQLTGHLTPAMLAREIEPLDPSVQVLVTHMKPGFEERIEADLAAIGRPGLRALRDGETLAF